MGSSEETPVVVTKHVTCTYKVTSAASTFMHHEALLINTFFIYTVYVKSISVECVYVQRVNIIYRRSAVADSTFFT